ncbi:hypothetical protein OEZ86_002217 [Tetradesmus obliquus]|nr:hypothetical protein OEZ86_002217 [Tetradesmus obliquus]
MAQTALAEYYVRRASQTSSIAPPISKAAREEYYYDESSFLGRMNKKFGQSKWGKYFDLEGRNTYLTAELRAGLVAFLTICYIIAVNPAILADTGGTCSMEHCTGPTAGTPGCKFDDDPGFLACKRQVKQSLVAATCISSAIGCFLMAFLANMPLAVAPGMGINAYFTYQVVGYHGSGRVTYEEALAAVFIESWIFLFISLIGLRGRLIELVPKHIMLATAVGIGLFLSHIGFQQAEGIGLITFDPATLVALGGCPPAGRAYMYTVKDTSQVCSVNPTTGLPQATGLGARSANYACVKYKMRSGTMWLGIWAGVLIVVLTYYEVKAGIMYGVLFATLVSWIPGSTVSYLTDATPGGAERFDYFRRVVDVPNPSKTALALQWSALKNGDAWVALITFLYLDFLDATGTLFTMARLINENVPGFIDDKARFPRRLITLCVDGVAILIGSLLGTSPLTVVAESSVGIKEGGRTGITAFVLGCGFVIAMFFAPIFSSIPGFATGPALVVVGTMMLGHAREINWDDLKVAFPSFLTIALMPLTYSIAYGVLTGILANVTLWVLFGGIDMFKAALKRDQAGRSPVRVFYDMFKCWRDAFEDFIPGVKAEWKQVFHNRVATTDGKKYDDPDQVARIASSNGAWDHLAVNYVATKPMGSGVVSYSEPPSALRTASLRAGSIAASDAAAAAAAIDAKGKDASARSTHKKGGEGGDAV